MSSIEINYIHKSYEGFKLEVDSLRFNSGEIIGVIGPNGAGKSTLLNILFNLEKPDKAEFRLFGTNFEVNRKMLLNNIGYVTDETSVFEDRSIYWNEKFFSSFYDNWNSNMFYDLMSKFSLDSDKKINELSKGMRIKAHIIFALSQQPQLLILDEPTSGIDPIDRSQVLKLLKEYVSEKTSRTLIISSHISEDLDQIADILLFMKDGKVLEHDTLRNLKKRYAGVSKISDLIDKLYESK
ncbi:hypothetical protein BK011_07865 [Tenericutes bacterium MZ-XQ]|nr:hypothetical protein BK011_07865 [Tenericutes bacterium MZ-XQ]